jgi:hypothetical protein
MGISTSGSRNDSYQVALVLSAGAPHSPLMAGALCALYKSYPKEKAPIFDIIYTSGAGALIGLLLAAPKNKKPDKALEGIVDLGISDPIYSVLPINYKAFQKPGPFTSPIRQFAKYWKLLDEFPIQPLSAPRSPIGACFNYCVEAARAWREASNGGFRRLYNDLIDLSAAAITPTTLNYWSKGVCDPLPFLEELVDFDELDRIKHDFYLNFFSPATVPKGKHADLAGESGTGKAMKLFANGAIRPEHVRAAFAYPFIYTPVRVDNDLAFEGATWDPISFGNLLSPAGTLSKAPEVAKIQTVVLIDIISNLEPFLLREPRNLWDAFGLSIIWPAVAHAKKELARFLGEVDKDTRRHKKHGFTVQTLQFDLDLKPEDGEHILDWSHSNMSRMFQIGLDAGQKFWAEHHDEFLSSQRFTRRAAARAGAPASP